jgi:uncharacterized membrane protein YccC
VLVPVVFAIADFGVGNTQTPIFAAFGAVALLLFTDFGGPIRLRLRSYLGLWAAGAVLMVLGTLCSTNAAAAVAGMAVSGFVVLYAGVVSPQAAVGATAALLTFVLPVATPGGPAVIGERLAGWVVAGACCIPPVLLVWSGRWHDQLRRKLAVASRAVADLVASHAGGHPYHEARRRSETALVELRAQFEATPYRPTGAGPTDVALTSLVSRMEWLGQSALLPQEGEAVLTQSRPTRRADGAVALVLRRIADLLDDGDPGSDAEQVGALADAVDQLAIARRAATTAAIDGFLADVEPEPGVAPGEVSASGDPPVWSADPIYRTRMLAFATETTAAVALRTAAAHRRHMGWVGRARTELQSNLRVAVASLSFRSVWFRNSLRGAAGLAMAVLVVEVTDVRHGFWVVLGALSVLRSNALGTGATALRAIAGTVVGFGVGSAVLVALGHHHALLWAVLPLAVLVAGTAPSVISFAAGQAGFTVVVVIVFNIVDPVGVAVGLVRVEDVAIGAAVSVVVGFLFWPRGATAELARALSQAFASATAWLSAAVADVGSGGPVADLSRRHAAADDASQRLDDAFRLYLAERGAKQVPLPTVTGLVTGCARINVSASTFDNLPAVVPVDGRPPPAAVVSMHRAMVDEFATAQQWYDQFAMALGDRRAPAPAPTKADDGLVPGLLDAFGQVRREHRADGVLALLRLLWVEERLEELRDLQAGLCSSAAEFVERAGGEHRL